MPRVPPVRHSPSLRQFSEWLERCSSYERFRSPSPTCPRTTKEASTCPPHSGSKYRVRVLSGAVPRENPLGWRDWPRLLSEAPPPEKSPGPCRALPWRALQADLPQSPFVFRRRFEGLRQGYI